MADSTYCPISHSCLVLLKGNAQYHVFEHHIEDTACLFIFILVIHMWDGQRLPRRLFRRQT